MATTTSTQSTRTVWTVRILIALAFGAAGLAKLLGVPSMVQLFEHIGFGQWFRYLTGFTEVLVALLLLIPTTGFLGSMLSTVTMICAIATHMLLIGGNPLPVITLALLGTFVAYRLRPSKARSQSTISFH